MIRTMIRAAGAGALALLLATACTEDGTLVEPMEEVDGPSQLVTNAGLEITNLEVASGRSYEVVDGGLVAGATRYVDRSYSLVDPVPTSLEGLTFIRTANHDKDANPGSGSFLSFDVGQDVVVYVAHDDRAVRPGWLDGGFTDTGVDLHDSDGASGAFSVFSARFPAGTITLGSNTVRSNASVSMYTVAVEAGQSGGSDTEAPTVPTELSAAAASDTRIDLSWTASTDDVGVDGYHVYRDGDRVAAVSGTSYSDTGLTPSTAYEYAVSAYDAAGNTSGRSDPASATTEAGGSSGPVSITNVDAESTSAYAIVDQGMEAGAVRYTDRRYVFESPVPSALEGLTFIRTANDDKDVHPGDASFLTFDVDQDVTVYVAHDDRAEPPAWLENGFTDTGMDLQASDPNTRGFSVFSAAFPAGTVTLGSNVSADQYGISMYSVLVRGEGGGGGGGGDTEAPTVPTELSATSTSSSSIDLSWTASSDDVGVAGYHVYRDGRRVADVSGTRYDDTGLSASTTYSYTVAAYDAAGNVSGQSSSASATTGSGSGSSGTLDLSNLEVESTNRYVIEEDGLDAGDVRYTDRSYTFESPIPSALVDRPFIRTANDDKEDNPGDASYMTFDANQDVTVYVVHDDRAELPTWLREGFTDTGMDLRDSDPNSRGFSVYSARFPAGTITLGSNVSTNDLGLSMYSVVIRGDGDAPTDTEAPTAPTGLSASAVSSSAIDLAWNASSDNIGVAGYYVYRDGSRIADVSGTRYDDTGLDASTSYRYAVAAYDAAGNTSSQSSSATATTDPSSGGGTGAIRDIAFDFSTHERRAPGSDNWPLTWADDGHQYTNWGDGGGFGGSNSSGRVLMGVARVEGSAGSYTGINVNGGVSPESGNTSFPTGSEWGKSRTMFFVDGTMYMLASRKSFTQICDGIYCAYERQQLWKSPDYGATWSQVTGTVWKYNDGETLGFHHFINMGRAYADAIDGYVYVSAIEVQDPTATQIQAPGELIMMRVPTGSIEDKSRYEYFSGTPESPSWSRNIADRRPVLTDPEGFARHSITYIPALDRFIMFSPHSGDDTGNLKVWEAPKPWGPWSLVREWRDDSGTGWTVPGEVQKWYFWDVSSKWISADGLNIVVTATGKEANDSWNTIEATLTVN